MKIRMVQLVILLAFVMVIVYMAQIPNGYGHPAAQHDQNKWIDDDGDWVQSTHAEAQDPRGLNFHRFLCSTKNGDEKVYGRGWFFRGGKLSGAKDGNRKHDQNDLSPIQQVYKLIVNTKAIASLYCVSGSVTPNIEEVRALPVQEDRFGGNATIKLDIFGTSYHEKKYTIFNPFLYVGCAERYVNAQFVHPHAKSIEIVVSPKQISTTETEQYETGVTATLGGETGGVGADLSATYITSWTSSRTDLHGFGYGIDDIIIATDPMHRRKKSDVEGELEHKSAISHIYAEFDDVTEMCPERNYYSGGLVPRINTIHVNKIVLW